MSSLSPNPPKDRRRRSSSIIGHLEPETIEERSDQSSSPNLNASWVNNKGAWVVHVVIIALLLIFYDLIPGVTSELSWTLTNITYVTGSYVMFHYVTGVPFEFNAGAYDSLTMWEQIDDGDQYTPAKKFLLGVPIGLFLISTHYTHYDITMFIVNCVFCLISVIPKLPSSHRLRITVPGMSET
ncbi:Orm1p [Sugiyamaella lignohabitans]|uniref:Orm1p n=1 Tax=Sugiyamaella lignohabitans TaxID=796027 RepID=A0A167CYC3_9ASCO|nr:Orm1p [Sugiyamaella lignohabitans]ANB12253.1 Orm1p [Sugiyamaella lignohabitans]